ncbi:MAG: CPBP family intramembrane glutamic endopeptidase [Peptostreptococcaceae bacterium]
MKKIYTFLGITFLLTWLITFGLMFNGGYSNPSATIIIASCMFMPAISVIITTLISKNKFKDVWIKPKFKGNIKYYLLAWLLPIILVLIGSAIYYIIFPSHFDSSMSTMITATKGQLSSLGKVVPSDDELKSLLLLQLATSIFIAPVVNFITCLGEELGWRGYLLPNLLEKMSPIKATIVSGIIWGVWHAPMIAMGHNYGLNYPTAPFGGIFAMIIFCVFVGSFLSYITIKSKSCIPAVIGHAMINGFAAIGVLFLAIPNPNPFIGPTPVGIIGGIGFIIAGLVSFKLISNINSQEEEITTN